jgi:hypothetical protein
MIIASPLRPQLSEPLPHAIDDAPHVRIKVLPDARALNFANSEIQFRAIEPAPIGEQIRSGCHGTTS